MQLCPILLPHHTMSSCLFLFPRESDFSGRVRLLLVWSHTLCLIGWSGFQLYYPSSQGDICLKRRPSRCFRPSARMFNTGALSWVRLASLEIAELTHHSRFQRTESGAGTIVGYASQADFRLQRFQVLVPAVLMKISLTQASICFIPRHILMFLPDHV